MRSQKNETPKLAPRDRRRNPALRPRFCDTQTEPPVAHAPCSRALCVKTIKSCKNNDWLAGAPGFEPGNGGIKIRLIIQQFQRAFGKWPKHAPAISIAWQPFPNEKGPSPGRSVPQNLDR